MTVCSFENAIRIGFSRAIADFWRFQMDCLHLNKNLKFYNRTTDKSFFVATRVQNIFKRGKNRFFCCHWVNGQRKEIGRTAIFPNTQKWHWENQKGAL